MKDQPAPRSRFLGLVIGALGVVYGDIGTSPLYSVQQCFDSSGGVAVNRGNVLGILSLIFWALTLIVSVKYLVFVLRADNRGEGGILALLSLAFPERRSGGHKSFMARSMVLLGVLGACLLYGDGIITPAVSVLGAVEGLKVANPAFGKYVVPITVVIIIALFAAQRAGTARVGGVFGPITLVWFIAIGVLGVRGIFLHPDVWLAVNPYYAIEFFVENRYPGFAVLGSVVLVVTGGEALYADMGHFGKRPIRMAWFWVVMPALLLNYFGQGALLLARPEAAANPFYQLCPTWALYPMIGLATAAAVIASQALISGAYSLTMQAIQLGFMPRLVVEHTSASERGQIYMPQVNWVLMLACIGLVITFRSSDGLAAAYGIAVTLTMLVTTILLYFAAQRLWHWKPWQAGILCGGVLLVELPLCAANFLKILHGGWFPLAVAVVVFTLMSTWKTGRRLLWQHVRSSVLPAEAFIESIREAPPIRVPGTAVYMAGSADGTPIALLHNLKHNKVLHQRVIFLTILSEEQPRVPVGERITVTELEHGFYRVIARFGFMEEPDVPAVLAACVEHGLTVKEMETTYFLSRETVIPTRKSGMAMWRERLFAIMSRNAQSATAFFNLPANRVVELGMQVEM